MATYNIPVQTEKNRQYLSEFQRKNLLNEQIDYLLSNPIQHNYEKINIVGDPSWNYGQKIWDPKEKEYMANPQAHQNIWRMHGEGDDYWDQDWENLYGEERYAPAISPLMAEQMGHNVYTREDDMGGALGGANYVPEGLTVPSVAYGNWQPNWDYIDALEIFRDNYVPGMNMNEIGIMSTEDAYKSRKMKVPDPEGNMQTITLPPELTGTGGFYDGGRQNIILNPANVVKKYPTAPMGPDSEWEFLAPNERNRLGAYWEEDEPWHTARILPHETAHHKAHRDWYYGLGEPNPGAYLEGIRWKDHYSDAERHPRMHMMDRSQWDWKSNLDKTLSKTQYQNFQDAHQKAMDASVNRGYQHEEDVDRTGSGRSRIENRGRPMYQSQASRAIEPTLPPSTAPDRSPRRHHFNEGGIAGLPGQWTPSMAESEEEEYNIRPLQLDPGIMSIEDLEDLFEEVGLDKSIIYKLINTGGLSQFVV